MTGDIHSCSLFCDLPARIKRQRDEYRQGLIDALNMVKPEQPADHVEDALNMVKAVQPALKPPLNWSTLVAWWESGAEDWEELKGIVTAMMAQPVLSGEVTDAENEQFSHDVSNFSGADPEATKYALEAFLSNRTATPQPAEDATP